MLLLICQLLFPLCTMCSPIKRNSRRLTEMWHSFSALRRVLLAVSTMLVLAVFCLAASNGFAQENTKKAPKHKTEPAGASQPATAGQASTSKPGATPSSGAESKEEKTDAEAKGPWHGLAWRLIGPYRGGRVLAVSGVVGDAHTYYFGGVGGGVWKTTDGGLAWRPLTDKTKNISASIVAIAVAPSHPHWIYAPTPQSCLPPT